MVHVMNIGDGFEAHIHIKNGHIIGKAVFKQSQAFMAVKVGIAMQKMSKNCK